MIRDDAHRIDAESRADFAFFPIELNFPERRAPLYVRGAYRPRAGRLEVAGGSRLSFDGFFSCLYEQEILSLGLPPEMSLRLSIAGSGTIELRRRDSTGADRQIESRPFSTDRPSEIRIGFSMPVDAELKARWYFVVCFDENSGGIIDRAEWCTSAQPGPPIRPEFVICTYRREQDVVRNVSALLSELGKADLDFGITIVDNARTIEKQPGWGEAVTLVSQRNLGGAGGFGRGILETLATGTATHIILMDDDADIETTSIIRMINLFRLTIGKEVFLGGMQLDSVAPTFLADAGSWWYPSEFLKVEGRVEVQDLAAAEALDTLAIPFRSNFNGWWLMGGPIRTFRRLGLPLPMFVHLDDVEYSIRILQGGASLVSVPGIAIWHQPPYKRTENWFTYYDVRNELIRLSLQSQGRHKRRRVVRRVRRKYAEMVRSRQYGSARLVSLAVRHFLEGPDILYTKDADTLHGEVLAIYRQADGSLDGAGPGKDVRMADELSRPQSWYSRRLARLTHFGHLLPDPFLKSDLAIVSLDSLVDLRPLYRRKRWASLAAGTDGARMTVFTMDRRRYLDCMIQMAGARFALWRGFDKARRAWLSESSRLVSEDYWRTLRFD